MEIGRPACWNMIAYIVETQNLGFYKQPGGVILQMMTFRFNKTLIFKAERLEDEITPPVCP